MPGTISGRQVLGDPILKRAAGRPHPAAWPESRRSWLPPCVRNRSCCTSRTIAHRPARVDDEIAAEIGLVLESFHVVAIGPGEETPVEIARVVAGLYSRYSLNSTENPWYGLR